MAVRKTSSGSAAQVAKIRLQNEESLSDVAHKLFKDRRLAPLLGDLNPEVGHGKLPAGTVVKVPSKQQAQQFAARMGFTLGYDPAKGGATTAKRRWNKVNAASAPAGHGANNDPVQLAELFVGQGIPADQAAKRIVALCDTEALEAALAERRVPEAVARHAIALKHRMWLRPRIKALVSILTSAQAPAGRLRSWQAAAAQPEEMVRILNGLLLPAPVQQAWLQAAHQVSDMVATATTLAEYDDSVRAHRQKAAGFDEPARAALVDAIVDGIDPLSDERTDALGGRGARAAFDRHMGMLEKTCRALLDNLDDTPGDILGAVVVGEGGATPKPWPVLDRILRLIGDDLAQAHAGVVDRGLAAFFANKNAGPRVSDAPRLTAADLVHQAARVAKVADDHGGIPDRLAPSVVALFALYRPQPEQAGSEAQKKQRRRGRFEKSALQKRDATFHVDVALSVLDELLDLATDHAELGRRAKRLKPPIKKGAATLLQQWRTPLQVLMRHASPVGKALLVAAVALDPELGPTLARGSGVEAAKGLAQTHGTTTLTMAITRYADRS